MAKITYASLKLKTNTEVNTFNFNDKTIEVLKYLPIADKYELLMSTILGSEPDGYFNEIMMDMVFDLNLVFYYTNITFTDKQKEDMTKLYDALESSGFMSEFFKAIDEEEYLTMREYLKTLKDSKERFDLSASSAIREFAEALPEGMSKAGDLIDGFDPEKYGAIQEMADAAGFNNQIKELL